MIKKYIIKKTVHPLCNGKHSNAKSFSSKTHPMSDWGAGREQLLIEAVKPTQDVTPKTQQTGRHQP